MPKDPQPIVKFPKSKSSIVVTAIYNPREVFVRSLDSADNAGYLHVLNEVHAYGREAEYLTQVPQCFSMVLVKNTKIFTRAFVVSVNGDICTVILVDFGNMERIHWSKLKELPEYIASLPRYVFRCNLVDVNAHDYTRKSVDYIKITATDEKKITYDAFNENEIPEVVLEISENDFTMAFTINEELKNFLQCSVKEVTWTTQSVPHVTGAPLLPSKDVEIIILDNEQLNYGIIHVAIYTQYLQFLQQWRVMQKQCGNLGDKYVPVRDTACLVRLEEDGNWHRAICEESNYHGILTIFLIDCGQRGKVNSNNSRKLIEDFDFVTPLKICRINGKKSITRSF